MSNQDYQQHQSLKEKASLGREIETMQQTNGWKIVEAKFKEIKADYQNIENAKGKTLEARLEALEAIRRVEAIWTELLTEGKNAASELSSPTEDY